MILGLKQEGRWVLNERQTRLVVTIAIEPRPGVFVPRPQELARHLHHELIARMGAVQHYREARQMREMYAVIAEMVHFESHVEVEE